MYRQNNICPICHCLRDINSQNFHHFEFVLYNGPRSNVNTPFDSQKATSSLLVIVICVLSVAVCKICSQNVYDLEFDL